MAKVAIGRLDRPQSLFDLALHEIRNAIIDGTIGLGEHLSELRISESLGVSKTPVREALQELRREGLVRVSANSGTVVFLPDEDEIRDIFDCRSLIELGAAKRMFERNSQKAAKQMADVVTRMKSACANEDHGTYRRLDSEFHSIIIEGAGNGMIVEAYAPLQSKVDSLRNRGLMDISVVHKSLEFHSRLSTYLTQGDERSFCSGLELHIANSRRDYTRWMDRRSRD